MKNSYLILTDGISGSGKGTQLQTIEDFFRSHNYTPHTIKEPSPFLADTLRNYRNQPDDQRDPEIETLLFTADRKHLLTTTIKPLLEQPRTAIISDRSYVTTCAYQSLQGTPLEKILELNAFYPPPDLTLIFLCDPAQALNRIHRRAHETNKPINTDENLEKITQLKQRYETIAAVLPTAVIIPTNGSKTAVSHQVHAHLKKTLGIPMHKTIFLDKDGTLVDNTGYPEKIPTDDVLLDHTVEGLKQLQKQHYKLIIISNQPWIAQQRTTRDHVEKTFRTILETYQRHGVTIDGYYYCPHTTTDHCTCKKPATGLLEQATDTFNIDLTQSYLVGDMNQDITAGKNLGLKTCKVKTGKTPPEPPLTSDYEAEDVNAFARLVLS